MGRHRTVSKSAEDSAPKEWDKTQRKNFKLLKEITEEEGKGRLSEHLINGFLLRIQGHEDVYEELQMLGGRLLETARK